MRISDGMIVRYEEHETPAWHRAKEDPKTSLRSSVSSEIQIQKFEMIHLPRGPIYKNKTMLLSMQIESLQWWISRVEQHMGQENTADVLSWQLRPRRFIIFHSSFES